VRHAQQWRSILVRSGRLATRWPSAVLIAAIRNCDFPFAGSALTMQSMDGRTKGSAMSNERPGVGGRLRELLDRLFEGLERAKLKDLERSIARAANEREVSQRVHRLEAGEAPFA
jgi:hypothetical protein